MAPALSRLLLPTTDAGVALQLVIGLGVLAWLWHRARGRPEWRLLVAGTAVLLVGLVGLRAAH